MINKIDPISGFIDYINTIKPYHTKILETNIELVCNDLVSVGVLEIDPNKKISRELSHIPSTIHENIVFIYE